MNTIKIKAAPVAGQRLYSKQSGKWELLLFRVTHVLEFEPSKVEVVSLSSDDTCLLIRSLNAPAVIRDTHFDFNSTTGNDELTWPQSCFLDGAAIISREPKGQFYKIETGMLRARCPAHMIQEHLTSLWPVAVPPNTEWDYLWTPYGLGIETLLSLEGDRQKRALLLPALNNVTDIAWRRDKNFADLSVKHLYAAKQEIYNAFKVANTHFGDYSPDSKVWPPTLVGGSTARRWRVLQTDAAGGLVEALLRLSGAPEDNITLDVLRHTMRSLPSPQQGTVSDVAIVADLWAAHDYRGKQKVEHRGVVIIPLTFDTRASMRWNNRGTASTLVAEQTHIACTYSSSTGELNRTHQTLEAGVKDDRKDLTIQFSPAPKLEKLEPVHVHLAGISPSPGESAMDDPRTSLPRWLALQDGWLDLNVSLYSDTDRPRAFLSEMMAGQKMLTGGVPLHEIGGPDGLSALLPDASNTAEVAPYVGLRIKVNRARVDGATLVINDAALLWETPAWWVLDEIRRVKDEQKPLQYQPILSPAVLPDLSSAFEAQFDGVNDVGPEGEKRLLAAVGRCFRSTVWIGHHTLDASEAEGWQLSSVSGNTQLEIAGLSTSPLLWGRTPGATVLATLPHDGQGDASILLDSTRSLTPLSPKNVKNLALRLSLTHGRLPVLSTSIVKGIEDPPHASWQHTGAEQFLPLAPGVGYNPESQEFQYRHAPQMATHCYLSQSLTGKSMSSVASLESARALDDLAIPAFKLVGGRASKDANLQLSGWIPFRNVPVTELNLNYQPRDENPSLTMKVGIGEKNSVTAPVSIGAVGSSFDAVPHLKASADFKNFWLEPAQASASGNFVGFGQALFSDASLGAFADGTGRHWTLFADGARNVISATVNQTRLNFTAQSRLSCSPGAGGSAVFVALFDVVAGSGDPASVWDLTGGVTATGDVSAPLAGPYPLIASQLVSATRERISTRFIVGQPFVQNTQGSADNLEDVLVCWTKLPGGDWRMSSEDGGKFDWRVRSPTLLETVSSAREGPKNISAIQLYRLEGTIRISEGLLELKVTAATLSTALGLLRFTTQKNPLVVETMDEGKEVVTVSLQTPDDPNGGFAVNIQLRCECDSDGDVAWYLKQGTAPAIIWNQPPLTLALLPNEPKAEICHLQTHPAAKVIPDFRVVFNQSSSRCFAFVHTQEASASALAGSIEVIQEEMPGLAWSLRESTLLHAGKLFGKTLSHAVRGDIQLHITTGNQQTILPDSTMTGWVKVLNDVQYAVGTKQYRQTVKLVFDGLPLPSEGMLPGNFDAIAQHAFAVNDDEEIAAFQGIHRFSVNSVNGVPYLQCTALLLLSEPPAGWQESWSAQVRLAGDEPIMTAQPPLQAGVIAGRLIRLAVRNRGETISVNVLASQKAPSLLGLPLVPVEPGKRENGGITDIWHERGALADSLSPTGLDRVAKYQTQASFAAAPFPQNGTAMSEWYHCLTDQQHWQAAIVSPARGVVLMPFAVKMGEAETTFAFSTQNAPNAAVRAELLCAQARGAARPLTRMASGLVHVAKNDSALQQWARQELRRQSSRSSGILVIPGDIKQTQTVPRSFQASAVSESAVDRALLALNPVPAFSAIAQGDLTHWQARMMAYADSHAVLEPLKSRPFAVNTGTGRVTRVARAALWQTDDVYHLNSAGVSLRQSITFKTRPLFSRWHWPAFRVYDSVQSEDSWSAVAPPLMDVTEWALRPGDMLSSTFWATSPTRPSFGPPIDIALRTARPTRTPLNKDLSIETPLFGRLQGVEWCLHRVRCSEFIGKPSRAAETGYQLSAVNPRGITHVTNSVSTPLVLGVTARVSKTGRGLIYREPLLVAAFDFSNATADPIELALISGNDTRVFSPESTVDVSDLLQSPDTWREGWRQQKCLILHRWKDELLPADVGSADAWLSTAARQISRLLDITDAPEASQSNDVPWLLSLDKATGPALALVQQDSNGQRLVHLNLQIVWKDVRAFTLPAHLLVAVNNRTVGFGIVSERGSIAMQDQRFIFQQMNFALEDVVTKETVTCAWRFGAGGGLTGFAIRD